METIKPIVGGLNGDRPDTLRNQFADNLMAIDEAITTLSTNMPNGRNYRSEEYREAREQYQKQIDNLIEAKEYMIEMLDHIDQNE